MLTDTPGIHHVTGIVRDAGANVDCYAGTLGLRLVKQTVNFNEKFTRHLFYGDATGSPGTVLTFLPYPAEEDGRVGKPQISAAGLVIPPAHPGRRTQLKYFDRLDPKTFRDFRQMLAGADL